MIQIRFAYKNDIFDIARIHHTSWHDAFDSLVPQKHKEAQTLPFLTGHWRTFFSQNNSTLLCAVQGEQPIGFSAFGTNAAGDGELFALYVAPDFQGTGAGSLLLEQSLHVLYTQGQRKAFVKVLHNNDRGQQFYTRKGARFIERKNMPDYHGSLEMCVFVFELLT